MFRRPLLLLSLLLSCIATIASAQNGPGGVGNVTGNSSLILWLRADQIAGKSDGDTISFWKDLSGYGNNATQSTASLRPTYETDAGNTINGNPVIRFYTDNTYLSNPAFNYSGDFTVIAVYNVPSARVSDWSKRVFSAPNGSQGDDGSGIALMEYSSGSVSPKSNLVTFTSKSTSRYCIGKRINSNGSVVDGLNEFDGNIAEMIVFNENLPYVRQVLVQNALNARYGVPIAEDHYSSTTYTTDVVGIGLASSVRHDSANSGGLILRNNGTLNQEGDYFITGHLPGTNSVVTTDVPSGVGARWSRDWYIDETGFLSGGSIKLEFDFGDGGIAGIPDDTSHFVLLARTGTSGAYNIVTSGNRTLVGDRVVFTLSDIAITDRYYTIGIADISDTNHAEHLSITGPGGIGTIDGTSSLALWLRADAITGMNDGDPLSIWFDQSGNWHNAIQPYLSLSPIYRNNTASNINGFPVLDFNADNAVLPHTTFNHSGQFTLLTVYAIPNVRTTNSSKRIFSAPSGTQRDNAEGLYIWESSSGPVAPKLVYSPFSGTRSTVSYAIGKEMLPDGTIVEGSNEFDGNIAEMIVFTEDLPYEKRVIVENYLAAKYAVIPVQTLYTEPDYKYDVAGIGRSSGSVASSRSGGMVLSDSGTLNTSGKYFLFGHNNARTIAVSSALPLGIAYRWQRDWYIDQTGYLGGNRLSIGFDFSDAGLEGVPAHAGNYRLLRRSSTSGTFSAVPTISTTIIGDRVVFEVYDTYITDGYYTLGTMSEDSPLPVQLVSFAARPTEPGVRLTWTTASEHNNRGFRLSRAIGSGGPFELIADYTSSTALSGQGRSEIATNYAYVDGEHFEPGMVLIYRLQSVDIDGSIPDNGMTAMASIPTVSSSSSDIVSVGSVTPTPFRSTVEIPFEASMAGTVTVTIVDSRGVIVHEETIEAVPGTNRYKLDGTAFPEGMYWARLRIGAHTIYRTLVHAE